LLTYIIAKEKSQIKMLKHPITKGRVIIVLFLYRIRKPTKEIRVAANNDKIE
jgi:hypothetical protein